MIQLDKLPFVKKIKRNTSLTSRELSFTKKPNHHLNIYFQRCKSSLKPMIRSSRSNACKTLIIKPKKRRSLKHVKHNFSQSTALFSNFPEQKTMTKEMSKKNLSVFLVYKKSKERKKKRENTLFQSIIPKVIQWKKRSKKIKSSLLIEKENIKRNSFTNKSNLLNSLHQNIQKKKSQVQVRRIDKEPIFNRIDRLKRQLKSIGRAFSKNK